MADLARKLKPGKQATARGRLRIGDDGRPDFRYVATHICRSVKRRLKAEGSIGLQGEFGVGLLSFWTVGEDLTMTSTGTDQRAYLACHCTSSSEASRCAPDLDGHSRLRQAREPVRVQAFVAQPAIEGFDVGVIGAFARPREDQLDAVGWDSLNFLRRNCRVCGGCKRLQRRPATRSDPAWGRYSRDCG